jgi:endonuclease/exonuclease/phosphatase family metal-dependent hydrolase
MSEANRARGAPGSTADLLKVVTLNTWGRGGPWEARRALIAAELDRLQPDIVGLQEIWHDAAGNTAEEIARTLAGTWHVHYAPAHEPEPGRTIGNAILSRHEFLEREAWPLPEPTGDWGRNLVFAIIATPWGKQPVFVTHLSWMFHHGAARLQQLQQVREWMKERAPIQRAATAPSELLPPLFMGDLNCVPESDEIRFVTGLMADAYGFYLADCFALCGEGVGHTWDKRNPFAALEPFPSRRIDYIFVRGPDRWRRGEPMLARIVFETPVDSVFASDHYGVYAEIRVGC